MKTSERMPAKQALETLCHTCERTGAFDIWTIKDSRYPEYNGLKVYSGLVSGEVVFSWSEDTAVSSTDSGSYLHLTPTKRVRLS